MKNLAILIFTSIFIFSCQNSSKGNWNDSDKKLAKESLNDFKNELNLLQNDKAAFIDCYCTTLENKYENFESTTQAGRTVVIVECMKSYVKKKLN
jgi:hypothetical protein